MEFAGGYVVGRMNKDHRHGRSLSEHIFDGGRVSRAIAEHDVIVVVDIETTGLYPARGDRIIEIGALRLDRGAVVDSFHRLVKTDRRIARQAQALHGITPAMLADGTPPTDVFPVFARWIGNSMLVSHNARFERAFLRHEFARLGLPLRNQWGCTLELSRQVFPGLPDHSLDTVYRHVCGALPPAIRRHRALDDARLAGGIWLAMIKDKRANTKRVDL